MNLSTPVLRSLCRLCSCTGFSNRYIAEILGISPGSVGKHQKQFKDLGLTWEQVKLMEDKALREMLYPRKKRRTNKVMPDLGKLHERLEKDKNLCLRVLHDEYQAIFKEQAYSYTQLSFRYRKFRRKLKLSARLKRYPGEAFYIDFAGTLIPWTNADENGREEKAQLFVMVAGFSCLTFAYAVPSQKIRNFIKAHVKGFEFFGGVPEVLVPDNLKSAVIKPGKDLVLNKSYGELADYYGTNVIPARICRPQDKGLAEQAVLHVTRWITTKLKERTFFSIDEINEAISPLLDELNNRPMTDYEKSRRERFEDNEKAVLKPLPKYAFKRVTAKITSEKVYIYFDGLCIAEHRRSDVVGGSTTDSNHQTPEHRAYSSQNLKSYVAWSKKVGPGAQKVVRAQYEGKRDDAMIANKACSRLKSVAELYGKEDFELACLRAIEIGSPNVSRIQSMLKSGVFKVPLESITEQPLLPEHSNIRGSNYYQLGDQHD